MDGVRNVELAGMNVEGEGKSGFYEYIVGTEYFGAAEPLNQ